MAKVNISIPDDLLVQVDKFADETYTSRSGYITSAVVQYLNQQKVSSALRDVADAFKVIAANDGIDDESMKTLRDFSRMVALLNK